MRRSYDLRFCWMLAVLLCLATSARATAHEAGAGSADDPVFVLPLDPQFVAVQAHISLAYPDATGVPVKGWDVSVFVDAKHCKLYCKFHHKASAESLIETSLPPVATIRLFSASGPYETVLVVDPGGTMLPKTRARGPLGPSLAATPSRQYASDFKFDRAMEFASVGSVRVAALDFDFEPPVAAPLPLRI